jgi:DNA-binding Lrp family transcriptional regulator
VKFLLDEVDRKLIDILRQDARTSHVEMAKSLRLSEGAIRRRIKRLVQNGEIRRFTIETAEEGPAAVMLVSVSPSVPTSQISTALKKMKGVRKVYEVTGEFDVIALLSASDTPALDTCIEKGRMLEGTTRTNTMMVLKSL